MSAHPEHDDSRTAASQLATPAVRRDSRDQLFKLGLLLRRTFRHLGKGVVVGIVGGVIALGAAFVLKRKYRSETVLLYRQLIDTRVLGDRENQGTPSRQVGMRLREFLLARSQLRKVIDTFKLYPRMVDERGHIAAIDEMRKNIDFRVRAGDTFHLAFMHSSPGVAKKVTERLAQSLIEYDTRLRSQRVTKTVEFIDAERRRVQKTLLGKERALAQFLAAHPEFADVAVQSGGSGTTAGASIRAEKAAKRARVVGVGVDPAVFALRRQAARIKARLGRSGAGGARVDPSLIAAKESAEQEHNAARGQLRKARNRFTELHPDVQSAKTRLSAAEARLKRVKAAVLGASTTARAKSRAEQARERSALRSELARIEQQIAQRQRRRSAKAGVVSKRDDPADRVVALETEWARLNRETQESRQRYIELENRQFRAALAASSETKAQSSQIEVLDPAFKPARPSGVGRTIVFLAGMTVTCVLALLIMLGFALMDDRVLHPVDLDNVRSAALLVVVPRHKKRRIGGRRGAREPRGGGR